MEINRFPMSWQQPYAIAGHQPHGAIPPELKEVEQRYSRFANRPIPQYQFPPRPPPMMNPYSLRDHPSSPFDPAMPSPMDVNKFRRQFAPRNYGFMPPQAGEFDYEDMAEDELLHEEPEYDLDLPTNLDHPFLRRQSPEMRAFCGAVVRKMLDMENRVSQMKAELDHTKNLLKKMQPDKEPVSILRGRGKPDHNPPSDDEKQTFMSDLYAPPPERSSLNLPQELRMPSPSTGDKQTQGGSAREERNKSLPVTKNDEIADLDAVLRRESERRARMKSGGGSPRSSTTPEGRKGKTFPKQVRFQEDLRSDERHPPAMDGPEDMGIGYSHQIRSIGHWHNM
jgi:hypothetical protein